MPSGTAKSLMSNSFYLMVDWIAATVLSMVFWLIVGKTLDTSGYGIVATTVNISLIIAALGMVGIRDVVVNLISRYSKRRMKDKVNGVVKFSLKFVLVSSVVSAGVVAIFSPQIASIINLPFETVLLVPVMIFGWGMWLLTTGILQGVQNMKMVFTTNLIGQIVKVALPIAFFFTTLGTVGPVIAFVASLLIIAALRVPGIPFGKSSPVNGRNIIIKLSLPVFISSVMWLVFTNLPNIILNSIKSPDITGLFALALTLVTPIVFIPMTLNQALFPITSGLSETKNPKGRQSKLISMVIKFAAFTTLPLIALLLVFSREVILFFSQPQYISAAELLPIVAPAAILLGIGQILVSNIFAIGKPIVTRNITIAVTILFIAMSIPATFMFSHFGMAYSYLVSMLVLVVTSFMYLNRKIGLSIEWKSIGKIMAAVLVFVAIALPLNGLTSSIPVKIAIALVGVAAYFLVLVPIRYYSMDEISILRYITSRSRSLRQKTAFLEKFLLNRV